MKVMYLWFTLLAFVHLQLAHGADDTGKAKTSAPSSTEKDFALGVRTSDPKSPAEELSTFAVPSGFRVELFAAEPDIAKPLNMAFDVQGRLWVTDTMEYPFPVEVGKPGRDSIKILADTDHDGRADTITTFADGLNIPIGLYPYRDGVICYSIPNIWFLRDTDGDGRCDRREVLYGPFDHTRDTHGMCNAFTRGYDGWVYACHGFNNQSTVRGTDGHTVTMHSGNTFRFRLDGSRIEHFTHGQVNPFGMALDSRGDLFTADCHTKPVTLLLRGGYYESFGKPHDGLGFVPSVMQHLHGSTAIGGIAIVQAPRTWPATYHHSSFGGNVMTSRINRNSLQYDGASVRAVKENDFLISGDSWFRPVDLQNGPDGALYVADFYNRIIGHYEVPLDHPGRDRRRGRIWKVSYVGEENRVAAKNQNRGNATSADRGNNLLALDTQHLMRKFRSSSSHQRLRALDQLADATSPLEIEAVRQGLLSDNEQVRLHCLWLLARRRQLTSKELERAIQDANELVRLHAQKILGADVSPISHDPQARCEWIAAGLRDIFPVVRRAAAEACLSVRHPLLVKALVECGYDVPGQDVHLKHAILIGLKHQLMDEGNFQRAMEDWTKQAEAQGKNVPSTDSLSTDDSSTDTSAVNILAKVCLALPHASAADFLSQSLAARQLPPDDADQFMAHAARYLSSDAVPTFVATVREKSLDGAAQASSSRQRNLIRLLHESLLQRGEPMPDALQSWAEDLAKQLLDRSQVDDPVVWTQESHGGLPSGSHTSPTWAESRRRSSEDGESASILWSSFVNGEQRTGVFRSSPFPLDRQFSFYFAGHDGYPGQELQNRNLVRVRAADDDTVLQTWVPPRQDIAVLQQWTTEEFAGREVYLELVDGDPSDAYAWLAVGRFSDPRLNPQDWQQHLEQACQLVEDFRLTSLGAELEERLKRELGRPALRQWVGRALAKLRDDPLSLILAESLGLQHLPPAIVERGSELLRVSTSQHPTNDDIAFRSYLTAALPFASSVEQQRLALQLTSTTVGLESLISLAEARSIQPQLLGNPSVRAAIQAVASDEQLGRIQQLLEGLPEEPASVAQAIRGLTSAYPKLVSNRDSGGREDRLARLDLGRQLFAKQCSICHQVAGQGKTVGPNLDGIGNRGLARLAEDVLAPNRNIDVAFRASTIVTSNGVARTGLVRPANAGMISLIDLQGKEHSIRQDDVEHTSSTHLSPMPANFSEVLSTEELCNLMSYLLSLRE